MEYHLIKLGDEEMKAELQRGDSDTLRVCAARRGGRLTQKAVPSICTSCRGSLLVIAIYFSVNQCEPFNYGPSVWPAR